MSPGREPGTTQSPSDSGRKAQPRESTEDEGVLRPKQSRVTEDLGLDMKGGVWTCGECHPHLLRTVAHTPPWRRRDGARPWLDPPMGVGARPFSQSGRPHHTDCLVYVHMFPYVLSVPTLDSPPPRAGPGSGRGLTGSVCPLPSASPRVGLGSSGAPHTSAPMSSRKPPVPEHNLAQTSHRPGGLQQITACPLAQVCTALAPVPWGLPSMRVTQPLMDH